MKLARIAFLAVLFSSTAEGQVGLVTDLSGKAGALAILSEVHPETTVKLEGELAVLYYASGDEFRFRGPALIAFGASGPKVLEGAPAKLAQQSKRVAVKPGGVVPATFVMRSAVSPELRARIEAARPAPNAPVSERVAFAAWLEQMGLADEAGRYWRALAGERPESAQLKALARN